MKTKSFNKFNFKKSKISNLESIKAGFKSPVESAQSYEDTTCASFSGCDTFR
ncbi:hypothetical protein [Kordia sp.]|uniref:hypothetical protein n=1 Tax=Kordia sp. TaxID=1965332 RepID=UPI0025C68EE9|nr:hypothetical protein [Kordia sp.]MCH2195481.1 hypothetical protein [Kordia sp.]